MPLAITVPLYLASVPRMFRRATGKSDIYLQDFQFSNVVLSEVMPECINASTCSETEVPSHYHESMGTRSESTVMIIFVATLVD
jgi:hypothetical protein